jgi:uncharacterized protein
MVVVSRITRRPPAAPSGLLRIALVSSAALLAACTAPREVFVATSSHAPDGITVTGSGDVQASPDVARLHLGVDERAATAEQAASQVTTKMNAVLAAVKNAGIADKDLRTSQLSLHRDFEPPFEPPPPEPQEAPPGPRGPGAPPDGPLSAPRPPPRPREAFRASNTVEITVRDLNRVSAVLGAATAAGANQVHGIHFTIDDPAPVEAQARDKAMADARARAEQLARVAGVTLGPVVSIQDGERGGGFPPPMPMDVSMRAEMGSAMPVERGELRIVRQVVVRYAIARK